MGDFGMSLENKKEFCNILARAATDGGESA